MLLTPLGIIFGSWAAVTLILMKRDWVPWLMSAAIPFMTTSAITIGDNKIAPFFLAAAAPTILAIVDFGRSRSGSQFVGLGLTLAAYYSITAAVLPLILR